jgi:hypothetical protein
MHEYFDADDAAGLYSDSAATAIPATSASRVAIDVIFLFLHLSPAREAQAMFAERC